MYTPYFERLLRDEAQYAEWRMLDKAFAERSERSDHLEAGESETLWQRLQALVGIHPQHPSSDNTTSYHHAAERSHSKTG